MSMNPLGASLELPVNIGTELLVEFQDFTLRTKSELIGMKYGQYLIIGMQHDMSGIRPETLKDSALIIRYLYRGSVYGFRTSVLNLLNSRDEKYADSSAGRYCPSLLEIVLHQTPYSKDPQRGTVRGVSFGDITVTGAQMPSSSFRGFDAEHAVEDVTIENLRFIGNRLQGASEARLHVGPNVRGVRFVDAAPSGAAAEPPSTAK